MLPSLVGSTPMRPRQEKRHDYTKNQEIGPLGLLLREVRTSVYPNRYPKTPAISCRWGVISSLVESTLVRPRP